MGTNCRHSKWIFFLAVYLLAIGCRPIHDPQIREIYASLPDQVDYNFHIKPILSDRCFKCHGPDANKRKADLRLDVEESTRNKTKSASSVAKRVIAPGNIRNSDLAQRILTQDENLVMPPPDAHLELSPLEKAMIIKWIEQGAKFKKHWSFIPPQKMELPKIKNLEWPQNPIDYYVAHKLESLGLEPGPGADKATLLRRVTLDLTGLPPKVHAIESFLEDTSDTAYEEIIDQLLSAPEYGERMAQSWLDVARYADSHGYQDDGMRNTWPWRDWVIKAFNQNIPYDSFLVWQIAGDMLPNPTTDQILATCFNRNHPQSQEGGVVDEEYRVEYVADRTNTLGKGILGLSLECARCHDHKYDPITQKEYYELFAYFNNNHDAGIVPYNGEAAPTLLLPSKKEKQKLDSLQSAIALLVEKSKPEHFRQAYLNWTETKKSVPIPNPYGLLADFSFEKEIEISARLIHLDKGPKPKSKGDSKKVFAYHNQQKQKLDATNWGHNDERPQVVMGTEGNGVQFNGDGGIRFNRDLDFDRNQPFSVSIWIQLLKEGEEGPIFNKTNGDFEGYRGWLCKLNKDGTLSFQLNHVWPDNSIDYKTEEPIALNTWTHVCLTYDGSSKANGVQFYINGNRPKFKLFSDNLKKSLLHGVKGSNWSNLPFLLGMELRKSIKHVVMDELKVYNRTLSKPEIKALSESNSIQYREPDSNLSWLSYYLLSGQNSDYNHIRSKLSMLRKEENLLMTDFLEVMVMKERKEIRPSYILERGAYDAKGEKVEPNVPLIISNQGSDFSKSRLGLAQWIVSKDHPLTARVAVNRIWAICFGQGLVSTQEDFGAQGQLPTHPDLLDWLAVRFMELDWNIKAFIKEIMLSATYQQSSFTNYKMQKIDPLNQWYSRFPAHRLPAETIRDQALAASGLLVRTLGGPSVYPYQPKGLWKALATRNATEYRQQTGDSLYRRSLYTIWKRSSPPPTMMSFDAPDRYYCVVRRQETATPLQSLILMNDPQFLEAARVLGERMEEEGGTSLDQKIHFACKTLLGRQPRETELQLLKDQYHKEYGILKLDKELRESWLRSGAFPVNRSIEETALATNTLIASTIMNFDEFVIKR